MAKGLDEVHPFSDTTLVDTVLRESEWMLSEKSNEVGPKNASRIWGFMSKFVMLDRFGKALGLGEVHPGVFIPRENFEKGYFGTATKVLLF